MPEDKKTRGKRKEAGSDNAVPCILEPQGMEKSSGITWQGLKQKVCEVDPLVYPKCQGAMRNIGLIEDGQA
jgi:hypothetical protein